MLDALLEDQDRRGVALGDFDRIGQISQIEVGGMPTTEKIDEIGGRKQQTLSKNLHRSQYNPLEGAVDIY